MPAGHPNIVILIAQSTAQTAVGTGIHALMMVRGLLIAQHAQVQAGMNQAAPVQTTLCQERATVLLQGVNGVRTAMHMGHIPAMLTGASLQDHAHSHAAKQAALQNAIPVQIILSRQEMAIVILTATLQATAAATIMMMHA